MNHFELLTDVLQELKNIKNLLEVVNNNETATVEQLKSVIDIARIQCSVVADDLDSFVSFNKGVIANE